MIPSSKTAIIALSLLLGGATSGWLVNGWRLEAKHDRLVQQLNENRLKDLFEKQLLREKEELRLNSIIEAYQEEIKRAHEEHRQRMADIGHGRVRLSIPVARCPELPAPSEDTARAVEGARAELDPATAQDLEAIAYDGDDAIRQLNALVLACKSR